MPRPEALGREQKLSDITRNIVDCYAAIINLYEDGDRIFLVGISPGA
jgi:uncharacterized protein (DUF2235 family)